VEQLPLLININNHNNCFYGRQRPYLPHPPTQKSPQKVKYYAMNFLLMYLTLALFSELKLSNVRNVWYCGEKKARGLDVYFSSELYLSKKKILFLGCLIVLDDFSNSVLKRFFFHLGGNLPVLHKHGGRCRVSVSTSLIVPNAEDHLSVAGVVYELALVPFRFAYIYVFFLRPVSLQLSESVWASIPSVSWLLKLLVSVLVFLLRGTTSLSALRKYAPQDGHISSR